MRVLSHASIGRPNRKALNHLTMHWENPSMAKSASTIGQNSIWESAPMASVLHTIERLGPTTLPVLITGESGTGKEVAARALHVASNRASNKLVVVDCAAIAPTLMESELFGHRKGAFTGASTTTPGLARIADGGTFFLDEIGELPTPIQVKLLRLLEDGSFRSVGGTETQQTDLRIIAATNRDVEAEVISGRFRRDLYHRLNGARIHLPPLRERRADILPLMQHYLTHAAHQAQRDPFTLTEKTQRVLEEAPWPGNVRELVNCAHFIASLAQNTQVGIEDLPPSFRQGPESPPSGWLPAEAHATPISAIRTDLPYKEAKREWLSIFETQYVQEILRLADGNVSKAARQSGMDRRSIQRILKRLNSPT